MNGSHRKSSFMTYPIILCSNTTRTCEVHGHRRQNTRKGKYRATSQSSYLPIAAFCSPNAMRGWTIHHRRESPQREGREAQLLSGLGRGYYRGRFVPKISARRERQKSSIPVRAGALPKEADISNAISMATLLSGRAACPLHIWQVLR